MKFKLIFYKILIISSAISSNDKICILIHGTWANQSDWHNPGGQFHETLKNNYKEQNIKLISFNWSGTLSYQKRNQAGQRLAELINSYPPKTNFILIGHSHGNNVGIIASQQIKQKNKIELHQEQ